MPAPLPENHFCIRCGNKGPWSDPGSLLCIPCADAKAAERQVYSRGYQRSRTRAIARLIATYPTVFDAYMMEERVKEKRRSKKAATSS